MPAEDLLIAERFCGPPRSGNGGYVCGLVARGLASGGPLGAVAVRLKSPPPLNTLLRREWTDDTARLLHGTAVVAEARRAELTLQPPGPPDLATARQAAASFPGLASHPFPRCFVCGPARAPGDGLRILPGPLPGASPDSPHHATTWTPDPSLAAADGAVQPEFIWAALDCPSGFAVFPVPDDITIVLGELTARITGALTAGEPVVVSAWPIGHDGRRRLAGSAIHRADGSLVAVARAVWIEVPARQWTEESRAP